MVPASEPRRGVLASLPANVEFVAVVRSVLRVVTATLPRGDAVLERIELPVVEAFTNAIVHGSRGAPDATVTVEIEAAVDRIAVTVCDRGGPFELPPAADTEVPAPLSEGGRGLFLMRRLSDELTVERRDDGNRVTLGWRLGGPAAGDVTCTDRPRR